MMCYYLNVQFQGQRVKAVEVTRSAFSLVGGVSPLVEEAKQSIARLFGWFRQNEDGCRIPGC